MTYFTYNDLYNDLFETAFRHQESTFLNDNGLTYLTSSLNALYAEFGLVYGRPDYSSLSQREYKELCGRESDLIAHCSRIIIKNPERFIKPVFISETDKEYYERLNSLLAKSIAI